jgi:hypothetical protein
MLELGDRAARLADSAKEARLAAGLFAYKCHQHLLNASAL